MTTKLDHSDSEDDGDYVPPVDAGSDSDYSDAGGEDNVAHVAPEKVDPDSKKKERDTLWSSFQASVAESSTPRNADPLPTTPRMVKIERKFRFAGKEVVEVVEVPEDSAEATKWPIWKETVEEASSAVVQDRMGSSSLLSTEPVANPGVKDDTTSVGSTHRSSPTAETLSSNTSAVTDKPAPKRPGPRKSKITLASLPGPSKAKKMTTLEKSAMDWKKHVHSAEESSASIKDELEANRRAGGYLEKVDFLKRVEERKEEALESLKSNKRRKL